MFGTKGRRPERSSVLSSGRWFSLEVFLDNGNYQSLRPSTPKRLFLSIIPIYILNYCRYLSRKDFLSQEVFGVSYYPLLLLYY
jgi:hypothetical protein